MKFRYPPSRKFIRRKKEFIRRYFDLSAVKIFYPPKIQIYPPNDLFPSKSLQNAHLLLSQSDSITNFGIQKAIRVSAAN
ncbi:hypothetical protein [Cytobacillus gottheilii]|uniref:hypothetical protein n=1 Tax=Cytobacillus gottheilii TaxID=859144 RepID=UPI0009BAEF8A|nr:hypothetical protein [Cytobacillus gottheilii]